MIIAVAEQVKTIACAEASDVIAPDDVQIVIAVSESDEVLSVGESNPVVAVAETPTFISAPQEVKVIAVALGMGGGGTGTSNSEKYTFTNADLTGTQLIRTHGLNDTVIQATITDSNGKTVMPAWIDSSLTTQVTVELKGTSIANAADGTWSIRLSA